MENNASVTSRACAERESHRLVRAFLYGFATMTFVQIFLL
jgi:hypothetical protein